MTGGMLEMEKRRERPLLALVSEQSRGHSEAGPECHSPEPPWGTWDWEVCVPIPWRPWGYQGRDVMVLSAERTELHGQRLQAGLQVQELHETCSQILGDDRH